MTHLLRKYVPVLVLLTLLLGGVLPTAPLRAQSAPPAPPVSVLVELDAPSAGEVYIAQLEQSVAQSADAATATAAAVAAAQAQVALISGQQTVLSGAFEALGAVTLYRAQRIYNAVAVMVPADQVAALAALPSVRAVHNLLAKEPDNRVSVPFLSAPALWSGGAGLPLTGQGVRIGIIDTGIDYIHTDFGGTGEGYSLNDPTRTNDSNAFPSVKVGGGFDFAGDHYNASPNSSAYQPIPTPDPDPMDCFGHGTHVAGTAAGYGVQSNGATYPGPYDDSTPFAALKVGPGVAPQATLYALKVFGCAGSSLIVDSAIEWAIDPNGDGDFGDHLDIINLSLGSPFGDSEDSTSVAADRAAQLGVIVIASAGNNGDVAYVAGSPGAANYAISVAATTARSDYSALDNGVSDTVSDFSSRGPRRDTTLKPDIAAPGFLITSAHSGAGSGALTLSGTSMAAPHVAGAMALLRQLHPAWRVEEMKALLMNTAMPAVRAEGPYTSTLASPIRAGAGRIDLAAAADAQVIALNADHPGVVNLSFGAPNVLGSFTAVHNVRVRNLGTVAQRFDVRYTASSDMPGVDIVTPLTVSVPAGGMAVVPVRFDATAAQMRNVSPVAPGASDVAVRAWQSEESGLLWLWPSPAQFSARLAPATTAIAPATFTLDVDSRTLAYTLPVPPDVAGTLESYTLDRGLPGAIDATATYALYARADGPAPTQPIVGSIVLDPADLPLLAGGYLTLRAFGSGTLAASVSGAISANTPVLKLPVYAAPRPAADMRAASPVLDFGSALNATQPLSLTGTTVAFSTTPTTTRPLVSVLELHARSPQAPASQQPPTPGQVDIKYVGVGSDYLAVANQADARIFFGIATYAPWSTPHEVLFNIYVDTDGDGSFDYRIFNGTTGAVSGVATRNDSFVTVVESSLESTRVSGGPLNILPPNSAQTEIFNSNVMLLSVPASALGVSADHPAIAFRVDATALTADGLVAGDAVDTMVYNIVRPGLNLTNGQAGSPLFTDAPSTKLSIGFNLVAYGTSSARGILLLHHHNRGDARAETVDVAFRWPTQLNFPFAAR